MTDTRQATDSVQNLFDALRLRETDRALALLDEKIVWHNVGLPKVRGISNVGRFLTLLAKPGYGFDVVLHNIAADGDVVLTERTDVLIWRRLRVEFWVCGTFELRDGKPVGLAVSVPTAEYLLALKLKAFRIMDPLRGETERLDILNLMHVVGISTADGAIALLGRYFPLSAASAEKQRFLLKHMSKEGAADAPKYPR